MLLTELVGQDQAVELLLRAASRGRTAHAYLFDGPEGVGKRTAARALALAIACPIAPGRGCGTCGVCQRMRAGHHPDLRTFDAATVGEVAKAAGVDNATDFVRERILPLAQERPHEAPARVVIIDHADALSPVMQNAALKTLEEPTPGAHIVLVTAAPERLLATIRSRTQRVRFVPVAGDKIAGLLIARGIDKTRAEIAATLADGSVGRALGLVEGDRESLIWDAVTKLREAAARPEVGPTFEMAAALGSKEQKDDLPDVLALLGKFYRDVLVTGSDAPDLVLLREHAAVIEAMAGRARVDANLAPLRRALAAVADTFVALEGNVNAVTAIERLAFALRPLERNGVRA